MIKINLLFFILSLFLAACSSVDLFQPPPYEYQRWRRVGSSEDDVIRALLECGVTTPRGRIRGRDEDVAMSPGEGALAARCMEGDGFKSDYDDSWVGYCRRWKQEIPACREDAPVRKRDTERRLNSIYCNEYPKARACQKT